MGIFEGCLLVSDLDDTLIYGGRVPRRNFDAVARFQREGGKFAFATGRAAPGTLPVLEQIRCNAPAIVYNGSMIYDFDSRRILASETLSTADRRLAFEAADRFPEIGLEVHSNLECYVLRSTPQIEWHVAYEHVPAASADAEELLHSSWQKALFSPRDVAAFEPLCAFLRERAGERRINLMPTSADDNGTIYRFLEFLPADVTKGTALPTLARLTGALPGRVFAIGDYDNDATMLAAADYAAVPAGACDTARAQADCVCCPCEEGAVAEFIDVIERRLRQS